MLKKLLALLLSLALFAAPPVALAGMGNPSGNPLAATPRALVNAYAVAAYTCGNLNGNVVAKQIASGALTSGVLSTVINVTGAGVVNWLSILTTDVTSRTIRVKVTLDGVVAYDFTSAACATANFGALMIGNFGTSGANAGLDQIPFSTSFKVEVASSVTETGKFTVYTIYRTN